MKCRAGGWLYSLRLLGALALPAGAGLAAGCGNDPYPAAERREALIYAAIGDDPKTLDPSFVYNITDGLVANAVYSCYFQYDYLKRDPFVLCLALGAEMPRRERIQVKGSDGKSGATGERWSFRIKRGLRFQDDPCFAGGKGREILASDFIYSFRRMADPAVACPILPYFEDKILGFHEYAEKLRRLAESGKPADYTLPVEGLQLDPRDPYVFRVALNQPYPQLRYIMAMAFTTPIAHEATVTYGKGFSKHPVGEGPYVLEEWLPKQRIVLRPNPNYRKDDLYPSSGEPADAQQGLLADAGRRLPINDGVVFTVTREGITSWNLFQQGYLDTYAVNQTNYSQVISRVGTITPQMAAKGITLARTTSPAVNYFAFNMKDPVVGGFGEKQKKLRQALSLCYDPQAEINLFDAGLGKVAQWLIPPGVTGYDPAFRNPYRETNLERARQLLAEAGYPDGVDRETGDRLEITFDNAYTDAAGRQFVGFLQKQFGEIGVRVVNRSWRAEVMQDRTDHGQYQFIDYGWIADYPDPENFVFLLYGPNTRQVNPAAYDRPEYNRLFERMRAMDDGPEREKVIRQMREIAVEDCPVILRSYAEDIRLTYPWIYNTKSHPVALDIFKYRRVNPALRAELRARWNRPRWWPVALFALLLLAGSVPAVATVRARGRQSARERGR